MQKFYTETVPIELAEKLKEMGMPIQVEFIPNYLGDPEGEAVSKIVPPSFAFVFDWLQEKNLSVCIFHEVDWSVGWSITHYYKTVHHGTHEEDWFTAATKAIKKSLELIEILKL